MTTVINTNDIHMEDKSTDLTTPQDIRRSVRLRLRNLRKQLDIREFPQISVAMDKAEVCENNEPCNNSIEAEFTKHDVD